MQCSESSLSVKTSISTTWDAYIILRKVGVMHVLYCSQPAGMSPSRYHIPYTNASSHCLLSGWERSCHTSATARRLKERFQSRTFAISPQVFPASLITFSLCSSAGLHGVFVLLFFCTGTGAISSPPSSVCSSRFPGSPSPGGIPEPVGYPDADNVPDTFGFLEGGELTAG